MRLKKLTLTLITSLTITCFTFSQVSYCFPIAPINPVGFSTVSENISLPSNTSKHYGITYDTQGNVLTENIKTNSSQGSWVFATKLTTINEIKYTYDSQGKLTNTDANETYRKTSSNAFGTILKAAIGIVATVVAGPIGAAVAGFVTSVASGADPLQALIGAGISFAAAYIGAELAQGLGFGTGFSFAHGSLENFISNPINIGIEALGIADQLMVNEKGQGLFEQAFGKWGGVVLGATQIFGGMMGGSIQNHAPPNTYQIISAIGKTLTLTASAVFGDKLNPYIKQFITGTVSSFFGAVAQGPNKQQKLLSEKFNLTQENITNSQTQTDQNGVPVYTKLKDGSLITYDYEGNATAIIPQGAEPIYQNGKITGSYINNGKYTEYYNDQGSYTARIIQGYTPIKQGDKIIGQTKDTLDNSYIYRDANGKFINKITETKDGGIIQNNGKTTTSFDNTNTKQWTRENYQHSDIYIYDEKGTNIKEILHTKTNEAGQTTGYTFTNPDTKEFTNYDTDIKYQGTYQARLNTEGNLIGYKGYDGQGNYTVLDNNQNTLYQIDQKGIGTIKDIDPTKTYLVLNPDAIHIVGTNDQIRYVIGQDQNTGMYKLYDSTGNKITDNPVTMALKLNVSLLTMPQALAQDIITNAKNYIAIAYSEIHKNDYTLREGDGIPLSARINGIRDNLSDLTWYITTDLSLQTLGTLGQIVSTPLQLLNIAYTSLDNAITNRTGQDLNEWNLKAVAGTAGTPLPQDDIISAITTGLNESLKGLPFVIGLLTSISRTENLADKIYDAGKLTNAGTDILLESKIAGQYTKLSLAGTKSFADELGDVLKSKWVTEDDFMDMVTKSADDLTDYERAIMRDIRSSVSAPVRDTVFSKTISRKDLEFYLRDDNPYKGKIGGYVSKSEDTNNIFTVKDNYNSKRLDYKDSPFAETDDYCVEIRFTTEKYSETEIPYNPAMGGTEVKGQPFTGNGFTMSKNGDVIPEYRFTDYVRPDDGSEIYKIYSDGTEEVVGVYKDGRFHRVS